MDEQQALDIVKALANGANPITGEVFAADSPYQFPDVIRALFIAQRALESQQHGRLSPSQPISATAPRKVAGSNAGKPWSPDEDKHLLAAFDADQPLAEIARAHERTVGGVRARLEKHGRLEPSAVTRWPQSHNQSRNQQEQSNGSRTSAT